MKADALFPGTHSCREHMTGNMQLTQQCYSDMSAMDVHVKPRETTEQDLCLNDIFVTSSQNKEDMVHEQSATNPAPFDPENEGPHGDKKKVEADIAHCDGNSSNPDTSGLMLWTTQRDSDVQLRMEESGVACLPPVTINQMFEEAVKQYGDYVALASKERDQWIKLTYKQYHEQCRLAAKGFIKLGLERYHGVGILGFNSAEWFIANIAAILAGGFAVGIYTTNSADACHYVAENCEANILVVENRKQLQKILQIQDQLPHLKAIIQYKDEIKEKQPNIYTWAEFMELGKDVPDVQLDQIISSQKPNQCCTLIYTSGTTGQPKGVMLSHDNITWTATAAGRAVRLREATDQQEIVVSYLPLSHVAAQMIDIWLTMKYGGATYFAMPDALKGSLVNTLKEVRPTAFMGVPRVWEKMQEKMKSVAAKSSTIRRKVASWAKGVGLETNLKRMNGCGRVISGCKTKIYQPDGDGSGEILFWGRHVFMGYLNMEVKTKESIDEEGWLHSGDIGKHDDKGFLFITGRIKELIITAGGENIPPVPIEDAMKEHLPIISNVMVIGDKRKFLSMLLTLKCNVNFDTGEPEDELTTEAIEFCQKLGSKATKVSDIVGPKDKLVYAAIQESVNAVNEKSTSNAQKVQKWMLLDKDFSIAGGELGPTMKLKRPVVSKMYKDQINNFYLDAVTPTDAVIPSKMQGKRNR
ncbi:long-chain-fatty-acid--CoA ligase ACSBG2 isoform X3 [Bufo bufo]|uniref:long-chain-fatty-acid--CoA ligase ACSBG2 isoform X3 n=1 Tax=Bufo bufo TaxID=8384 RepID=UPI001ABEE685|nr:long-chain-fatty-acid--CoA ligase ACSBG2 isoform X3 [Bufo bufo]